MSETDGAKIRELIQAWLSASEAGDVDAVLGLMSDDVVFLVNGQEPFGRDQFAASLRAMSEQGICVRAHSEVKEVVVSGEWAWCRTQLSVTVTAPGAPPGHRKGPTLTVFRRRPGGGWVISRDANLLSAVPG